MIEVIELSALRGTPKVHEGGSVFLGYCDPTFATPEGFTFKLRDVVVRLNTKGVPTLDLPQGDLVKLKGAREGEVIRIRKFEFADESSMRDAAHAVCAHQSVQSVLEAVKAQLAA